ncbi:DUF1428 domain-containing protein [Sphingomonas sp. BGYR3]|uniref:DUF1428 domain-containing protein n=1 Tax=Sphingomonas sp. BGYR3 TaxID=2975483 RepID=UPI0021A61199|nr:DUF1428 domain-containing protein [Sphingomonas sp. BGYR3]MDG5489290.1 DUF1428 domain-containing protein [Sphingomonas sp. BGYR3]
MTYIDGFVLPVPEARRQDYHDLATRMSGVFRRHGALHVVEAWAEDVPKGEHTDFWMAVKAVEGETVVFSWIVWPDKATRDAGWAAVMADEESQGNATTDMPFDGKRMFWGGFTPFVDDRG